MYTDGDDSEDPKPDHWHELKLGQAIPPAYIFWSAEGWREADPPTFAGEVFGDSIWHPERIKYWDKNK
jgi:hypothetical protein